MSEAIQVLSTVKLDDETIERLQALSPALKIKVYPEDKTKEVPSKAWEQADIVFTASHLPPATVKTPIKWIHSLYAGVDHMLQDPFIVANPDIIITSSSGIHVSKIGELAVAFILALGHSIPLMLKHQATATWSEERHTIFMPRELSKSTVGILGYGRLGREIARLCKAFGATILATKRDLMKPANHGYTLPDTGDPEGELFDRLYPSEATAFMVKDCDFVVITLPLTEGTRGLFGQRMFDAMKRTAYLINLGRGGVVDEQALLAALQNGKLAGAAFDVFAQEPLPAESPLWKAPNMIISPHIGGLMPDYREKSTVIFEENLKLFLEKKPLMNVVDRAQGY